MTHPWLGAFFALLSAITWAVALVFFKRSGESLSPMPLNLFKNLVAILLFSVTLLFDMGDGYTRVAGLPMRDFAVLALSGILGIAVADSIFLHSLNLVGVGIFSIVDCSYSPFVFLFSFLLLGEHLTPVQYLGAALILGGVLISSRHPPPPDRSRRQIVLGVCLAALAIGLMAFSIVMAKPVIERISPIWATAIRLLAGTFALLLVMAPTFHRSMWEFLRPSRMWRMAVPGAVLGSYLSMLFWVAGFKYTYASVAAILNQSTVIFSLILASVVLKEPFGGRKLVAVILALAGVLIVTTAQSQPSEPPVTDQARDLRDAAQTHTAPAAQAPHERHDQLRSAGRFDSLLAASDVSPGTTRAAIARQRGHCTSSPRVRTVARGGWRIPMAKPHFEQVRR